MKAIVFVRCSTEKQELASQIQETTAYAQQLGYDELTVIGAKGASAVKLNDIYNEKINELFQTIEHDKPAAVVVWHLNRIARNEEMAMKVKNYLIKHQIQLHVKEPTITLLNEDKTVNTGAELAFSLFATMAKQQAEELRKKSSRGLQRNIEMKKYTGGKILYGYCYDEQGFTHIDPETGKIVKEIFEEYATDRYSYQTLQKEMNSRYAIEFTVQWYRQKIGNEAYYNGHGYDPIITEELFNKCLEIRSKREKPMIQKYHTFANRILKCSKCGRGYTLSRSRKDLIYRCSGCGQGDRISTANLDGLLWMISSDLEANYLETTDTNKELRQKQAVLGAKIKTLDRYTSKAEKARQRAKEAYLNGVIELEEYQDRIKKTEIDADQARKDKERMENEVRQLQDIIEAKGGKVQKMMDIAGKLQESTLEEMNSIVRKWVKRITYNEGIVTIETLSKTYKALYKANSKTHWRTVYGNTLLAPRVEHDKRELLKPEKVDQNSLVNTLAWLAGSEII